MSELGFATFTSSRTDGRTGRVLRRRLLAALEGEFAADVETIAEERGRIVLLTRQQLLPQH